MCENQTQVGESDLLKNIVSLLSIEKIKYLELWRERDFICLAVYALEPECVAGWGDHILYLLRTTLDEKDYGVDRDDTSWWLKIRVNKDCW